MVQSQNYDMLELIPRMVTEEENDSTVRLPEKNEVKEVVYHLSGDSVAGPDGFSRLFFQKYWDIIGDDVTLVVKAFFYGHELPKYVIHTNLILIPKKDLPRSFSDFRPISLSRFINKMISRVLHERIDEVIPKMISPNQSGFVKGRSNVENVLLYQEIIKDINRRKKHVNMVVKLDMAKVDDRVSWIFLTKVLRRFCFSEVVINMVWILISNNWYTILMNGQPYGFFQSSRGLKQGDPLSLLSSLLEQKFFLGVSISYIEMMILLGMVC